MYDKMDVVINGSLLHDIGKIVFRNDHTYHNHSEAGAKFISSENIDILNKAEVLECISYHHHNFLKAANLSRNSIAYIVYEADNIASGLDRRVVYDSSDPTLFDEKVPLHSVFNQLNCHRNNFTGAYPLSPPFRSEIISIPKQDITGLRDTTTQSGYGSLISLLRKSLSEMNGVLDSPNSLLKILEAVAAHVPSSTSLKEIPDISLYDHLKITCAIASCMYMYAESKGVTDYKSLFFDNSDFRDQDAFLLVSGDLSGIQDFIYTISSKGALKSLRGRSLYLEMITENVSDEILESFGLTRANLLYSGGGHFYMLLPNIAHVRESLPEIKDKINCDFLQKFSIALYLELGFVPCSADELGNGLQEKSKKKNLLGQVFENLSKTMSKNKIQRYQNGALEDIFSPESVYNKKSQYERECVVCGESEHLVTFQGNDSVLSCSLCDKLATLGKDIAKINGAKDKHLIVIKAEDDDAYDNNDDNDDLGIPLPSIYGNRFLKVEKLEQIEAALKTRPDAYKRIYSINELMSGMKYATNLWIGNYNKRTDDNRAVDFKDLAAESTGIKRLGILRADVDNLGQAFTRGFEKADPARDSRHNAVTLSRNAAFSRAMSMFFKYEINKLGDGRADRQFNFRLPGSQKELQGKEKNIVVVYSGGDDIFAVGPWDEVIEFAVNLRDAFNAFSLGRLTLSGGIGLFPESYPISQMALKTGELEDAAKEFNNSQKNSVALFGKEDNEVRHIYSWDEFKESVCLDKMNKLVNWFYFDENDKEKYPEKLYAGMSLMYRLYRLFSHEATVNVARLAYLLGRMKPGDRDSDNLETYRSVRTELYSWALDEKQRRQAATALNILILLNRKEKED